MTPAGQTAQLVQTIADEVAVQGEAVETVAVGAGMAPAALQRILDGSEPLHVDELHNIARTLGLTASD
jgi:hypothetical protein